jgi:hypothetical protein
MTVHYHGVPVTPRAELVKLAGFSLCVGFVRPSQLNTCLEIAQSVMLDNGAFTFWRRGVQTEREWWQRYYAWVEPHLSHTTWAVIPDVIDGTTEENDVLLRDWPFGDRGAPVWHVHEPVRRLLELAFSWPRVCIGSSGVYSRPGSAAWTARMTRALDALCGRGKPPPVQLHMLRGMSLCGGPWPFASVDSASAARNFKDHGRDLTVVARRWDAVQCPAVWNGP